MGKKSRVKIQKSGSGAAAAVSPKEMMNLINELLQSESRRQRMTSVLTWSHHYLLLVIKEFVQSLFLPPECSAAAPSAGKEWEEYVQIRGLVEKIRKKQKGQSLHWNPPCELL